MFTLSQEKLAAMGAAVTAAEIKQQPDLWEETFTLYKTKQQDIQAFLKKLEERHERMRVIFSGAGTSAYVGNTVTPYLKGQVDEKKWELLSIPTTTLVANPYEFLKEEIPTLLVSFARSGNSPESVAAVELAGKIVKDFYQVTITCAKEGELAKRAGNDAENLLLLMPEKANDQGFAMTGSYSCMALTALLVFDPMPEHEKARIVEEIVRMGNGVIQREGDIKKIVETDFDRIVYLGSGSLEGLAQEAQLKILELTAGKIATAFDSPLGFRHGPKSFVNDKTIVLVFVSNHPYTRKYDLDILKELQADHIAAYIGAIGTDAAGQFEGDGFLFNDSASMPDAYMALPYVMVGQTISLLAALKAGNTPDTPSPTGTVNRVVKGVTIHEYE